ncbi:membrane hypothetical protein [Gammaproteobacteria bacterium]
MMCVWGILFFEITSTLSQEELVLVQSIRDAPWVVEHRHWMQLLSNWGMYPFYVFFLGILFLRIPKFQFVAWSWFWAELLGSGFLVFLIKTLTGRARPEYALANGFSETWFSQIFSHTYQSFPSGHTTDLFTSALFVGLLTRTPLVVIPAFLLASLVAFSRIALAKHYLSDVLAGMLIATVSTFLSVRNIQPNVKT